MKRIASPGQPVTKEGFSQRLADLAYSMGPLEDDKELLQVIAEAWDYAMRSGRIEPAEPRRIIAMAWYGLSVCRAGRQAEGLRLSQQAVDDARKYHGSSSRATEVALGTLGFTFQSAFAIRSVPLSPRGNPMRLRSSASRLNRKTGPFDSPC